MLLRSGTRKSADTVLGKRARATAAKGQPKGKKAKTETKDAAPPPPEDTKAAAPQPLQDAAPPPAETKAAAPPVSDDTKIVQIAFRPPSFAQQYFSVHPREVDDQGRDKYVAITELLTPVSLSASACWGDVVQVIETRTRELRAGAALLHNTMYVFAHECEDDLKGKRLGVDVPLAANVRPNTTLLVVGLTRAVQSIHLSYKLWKADAKSCWPPATNWFGRDHFTGGEFFAYGRENPMTQMVVVRMGPRTEDAAAYDLASYKHWLTESLKSQGHDVRLVDPILKRTYPVGAVRVLTLVYEAQRTRQDVGDQVFEPVMVTLV